MGFVALVLEYRGRLEAVYAAPVPDDEKPRRKREVLGEMREDYARIRESWGGYGGYDRWFAQDLGNAQLASVAAYARLVPAFQALLAEQGGDLPRFYEAVRRVSRLDGGERAARLAELAARQPRAADAGGPAADSESQFRSAAMLDPLSPAPLPQGERGDLRGKWTVVHFPGLH